MTRGFKGPRKFEWMETSMESRESPNVTCNRLCLINPQLLHQAHLKDVGLTNTWGGHPCVCRELCETNDSVALSHEG